MLEVVIIVVIGSVLWGAATKSLQAKAAASTQTGFVATQPTSVSQSPSPWSNFTSTTAQLAGGGFFLQNPANSDSSAAAAAAAGSSTPSTPSGSGGGATSPSGGASGAGAGAGAGGAGKGVLQ